ncbi:hypothetical protein BH24ACT26_BH24ACT26_21050 [soil metagenome]
MDAEDHEARRELDRILEFVHAIEARSSTRAVPMKWGVEIFNDDFPRSWAHNFLRVEGDLEGVSVEGLVEEAERFHGAAGHAHRAITVEDEAMAEGLRGSFEDLGWVVDRLLTMVHCRGRGVPANTSGVEEVDFDTVRPALEEFLRGMPYADSEETVRQLVERSLLTAAATDVRHFAVLVEGRVVSNCDLYSDGEVAQIEDVTTLEGFRGKGFARATVGKALEEALAAQHQLVFLVADDDDWPKEFYARLGFEPVGRSHNFTLPGTPV